MDIFKQPLIKMVVGQPVAGVLKFRIDGVFDEIEKG